MAVNLSTTSSIVDFLNLSGKDSSYTARQKLYKDSGLESRLGSYTGSGDQNVNLLNTLRSQGTNQTLIPQTSIPQNQTPAFASASNPVPTTQYSAPIGPAVNTYNTATNQQPVYTPPPQTTAINTTDVAAQIARAQAMLAQTQAEGNKPFAGSTYEQALTQSTPTPTPTPPITASDTLKTLGLDINKQLTPEELTQQVENDPAYKLYMEALGNKTRAESASAEAKKQELQVQYEQNKDTLENNLAQSGLAFSGIRSQDVKSLTDSLASSTLSVDRETAASLLEADVNARAKFLDIATNIIQEAANEACDDERYYSHPLDFGTTTYLEGRGIYVHRLLRVHVDPVAGNHSARNKGVEMARGKYVFFSDAHMSYGQGFFKKMIQATEESCGLVHAGIGWMGGFPARSGTIGMQYTLKLGEEIKGTWAPYIVVPDKWFYIAAQGHCSVMVNRQQFLDFGGYPDVHRSYGGGEFYTDMKWWLFGSSVVVEPRAIGYHLASGRGYTYNHDDYIHNVLNIAYALGMDDWRERAYLNWLRRGRKEVLDRIMKQGELEMESDRAFIKKRMKKSFNELIAEQPWNVMNKEKFGRANGGVQILHDTWLPLVKGTPAEQAYKESKYQNGLENFINENLSQYVYKRNPNAPVFAKDILNL